MAAACPLCLRVTLREEIRLGFRPLSPSAADDDEEWPKGHFMCGPVEDADLDRWVAGENPVLTPRGWEWPE